MFKTLFIVVPTLLLCNGIKGPVDPYGDNVLEVTIFSYYSSSKSENENDEDVDNRGAITGHAFLQIKNISGSYKIVGHHGIGNNSCFTIGCWPTPVILPQIDQFTGQIITPGQNGAIWYNNEIHDSSGWSSLPHSSLSMNVNNLGFDAISTFLTNGSNSYYDLLTHTCANVAVNVWNMVASSSLQLSPTYPNLPRYVKEAIETKSGYVSGGSYNSGSVWGYVKYSDGTLV